MGIPELFGKFVRQLKRTRIKAPHIEGVLLDLPGLLHRIAEETYLYGDNVKVTDAQYAAASKKTPRQLLDEYVVALGKKLSEIVSTFAPRQYMIICVDGIAPIAKIAEQRKRRYGQLQIQQQPQHRGGAGGDTQPHRPPVGGFSRVMITSGTPFMFEIDKYIEAWIRFNISYKGGRHLPRVIVYSPQRVPGEGEHKMFAELRRLIADGSVSPEGTGGAHVVFGKDADLLMLSLVAAPTVERISIVREDYAEVVDVDELYEYIRGFMTANGAAPSAALSRRQICLDFVLIAMLIGNDFLPRMPSVEARFTGSTILETYANVGVPIVKDGGNGNAASISLSAFANFMLLFAQNERGLLGAMMASELADEGSRQARVAPSRALRVATSAGTHPVDIGLLRTVWYSIEHDMYSAIHPKVVASEKLPPVAAIPELMATAYVAVMNWVLRYYTGGGASVNWLFAYPFVTAPLAADIAATLIPAARKFPPNANVEQFFAENRERLVAAHGLSLDGFTDATGPPIGRGKSAFDFAHQLIATLTPRAIRAYTKAPLLADLIDGDDPPLKYVVPSGPIQYYADGIRAPHMAASLIPRIDPLDVRLAIEAADVKFREVQLAEFAAMRRADPNAGRRRRVTAAGKLVPDFPVTKLKYMYPGTMRTDALATTTYVIEPPRAPPAAPRRQQRK